MNNIDMLIELEVGRATYDDDRCKFETDWLDADNYVVNCLVSKECPAELAEEKVGKLADSIVKILNRWYPRDNPKECWHRCDEPTYWACEDGEVDYPEDIPDGGCVQFAICETDK